jgi:hypothetical protein
MDEYSFLSWAKLRCDRLRSQRRQGSRPGLEEPAQVPRCARRHPLPRRHGWVPLLHWR